MIELYHAQARIRDLHREAAARSLANSVPAKRRPARSHPALTSAEVETHRPVAYPAVIAALQ